VNTLVMQCRRQRRRLQLASRVEALPPWVWLSLQAIALWPSLAWGARRLADGSDEPLGLVALALLVVATLAGRVHCQREARLPWLMVALLLTVLTTSLLPVLPPLALGVLSALALASAFAAFRAPGSPWLPVAGLLLLALPVIASAQFYAGWPLRVITAEASRNLLELGGLEALRHGATLWVNGREVLVDAPCSGVQLAWLGYCAACAAALWLGLPDRAFASRLPLVGLLVLAGNIVRNTVLVAIESGAVRAPGWSHEAVGLGVLSAVVMLVVLAIRGGADAAHR
jgi:exosortase/archaeosortase family protein